MVDFTLIETLDALAAAAEIWEKEPEIAFDIECENNLHHYGTYITLFQVSSRTANWVIDVLALKIIDPLLHVLENPPVLKVLHDVSFDLRILLTSFSADRRICLTHSWQRCSWIKRKSAWVSY